MKTITTAVTVLPAGHDLLSEMATTISIEDEGAGAFVAIEQHIGLRPSKVAITIEEWPAIRAAIEQMFESCRSLGDAS